MKPRRPRKRFRLYVWIPVVILVCGWIASAVVDDQLRIGFGGHELKLGTAAGWAAMTWMPNVDGVVGVRNAWTRTSLLSQNGKQPRVFSSAGNYQFSCPIWFAAAVAAVAAASVTFVSGYRKPGLCAECGYDLRATTGRCPECGTATTT